MLKVEDRDILDFLEGRASKQVKKQVKEWAYGSLENANDLAHIKIVHDATSHLSEYNAVDVKAEWKTFKKSTGDTVAADTFSMVSESNLSDRDLLRYIDGEIVSSEKNRVDKILSQDSNLAADTALMKSILEETPGVLNYVDADVDAEWSLLKTKMSPAAAIIDMPAVQSTTTVQTHMPKVEKVVAPSVQQVPTSSPSYLAEEERSTIVPMWMRYAAAAAVLLIGGFFFWNNSRTNPNEIITYATTDEPMEIQLADGSMVYLGSHSTLQSPKSYDGLYERKQIMTGTAEFDVVEDQTKPFIVEVVEDDLGIEVLGTRFKVMPHPDFVKVAENIEGKVRFYKLTEKDLNVILEQGDKYGYDGAAFVDMNMPEEDNSKEYNILYVLDYLMANSAWKVISSPDMPFDENGMVKVDLEQPIEEILESLRDRADFEYVELSCDNCYRVTRFKGQE